MIENTFRYFIKNIIIKRLDEKIISRREQNEMSTSRAE